MSRLSHRHIAVDKLTAQEASLELATLAKELAQHNSAYHTHDAPLIADIEYDELFKRNAAIELRFPELVRNDSAGLKIGAPIASGFSSIKHGAPMLSLSNIFTDEEAVQFFNRIRQALIFNALVPDLLTVVAEPKIDGLAVSLRYMNRRLMHAATRGDGITGEDVTANVQYISDIPKTLPSDASQDAIEIRGEVYMAKDDFAQLNEMQIKLGNKPFATPRHAAAGSLRQLDARITGSRKLRFFPYAAGEITGTSWNTQVEFLLQLIQWGFTVNPLITPCKSPDEMLARYNHILKKRPNLQYDIDGVVYKLDNWPLRDKLGSSARSPNWAVAHKFPAEESLTTLTGITIQVGRSGVLTPVASLSPVSIGGVMIASATLHNSDFIAERDIRIGDTVKLRRAGDVIPQVMGVVNTANHDALPAYVFPKVCPSCGQPVYREDGEAAVRCLNGLHCDAQIQERLNHFVSRDALDIDGLGPQRITELHGAGLIKVPGDIFRLAPTQLEGLSGWGDASIQKLIKAIHDKRTVSLERFIYSLGIPHVGQETSRILANHYKSIDQLYDADTESVVHLLELPGIGKTTAECFVQFFKNEANHNILRDLCIQLNVQPAKILTTPATPSAIFGKTIVFTGMLTSMSRTEAKSKAEECGAHVVNSISKKVDLVVVGSDAGSKQQVAKNLGLATIGEAEWLSYLSL